MTPIEISEYKMRWMQNENNPVRIHSDLRSRAKDYCKSHMNTASWKLTEYTNVYEDTFFFEYSENAHDFRTHFNKWVDI